VQVVARPWREDVALAVRSISSRRFGAGSVRLCNTNVPPPCRPRVTAPGVSPALVRPGGGEGQALIMTQPDSTINWATCSRLASNGRHSPVVCPRQPRRSRNCTIAHFQTIRDIYAVHIVLKPPQAVGKYACTPSASLCLPIDEFVATHQGPCQGTSRVGSFAGTRVGSDRAGQALGKSPLSRWCGSMNFCFLTVGQSHHRYRALARRAVRPLISAAIRSGAG